MQDIAARVANAACACGCLALNRLFLLAPDGAHAGSGLQITKRIRNVCQEPSRMPSLTARWGLLCDSAPLHRTTTRTALSVVGRAAGAVEKRRISSRMRLGASVSPAAAGSALCISGQQRGDRQRRHEHPHIIAKNRTLVPSPKRPALMAKPPCQAARLRAAPPSHRLPGPAHSAAANRRSDARVASPSPFPQSPPRRAAPRRVRRPPSTRRPRRRPP